MKNLYNLKKLEVSNSFSTEEFAMLSVYLSNTKSDLFKPYSITKGLGYPDGTRDPIELMITGNRKPFLRFDKDKKKIIKYVKEFKDFQKKYIEEKNKN